MTTREERSEGYEIAPPEIIQFPDRLRETIGNDSLRGFARKCDFSEGVLRNYLKGSTYPSLDKLVIIAKMGGVSVNWLATGEAEVLKPYRIKPAAIDDDFFIRVSLIVDSIVREKSITLAGVQLLRHYIHFYEVFHENGNIDVEMVKNALTLSVPKTFFASSDEAISDLIDLLAKADAKTPKEEKKLVSAWWKKLAEKFDGELLLFNTTERPRIVEWLKGELERRMVCRAPIDRA